MFGLMRPKKELVGKRIQIVKNDLNVSFAELGRRLNLLRPTINSYAQGYTLAPLEVIEQLSKISGKSVGWFYFGEMEEYIRDYLIKTGHGAVLTDYPDVPDELKNIFLNNKNSGWIWYNNFGYPDESVMDDCFSEIYYDIMKKYISTFAREYVASHSSLEPAQQEETIAVITSDVYRTFCMFRDLEYGDEADIKELVEECYEETAKNGRIMYSDEYLVGRLINILGDYSQSARLISVLSEQLTGKGFNTLLGGDKLITAFQTMRPALIELYRNSSIDDYFDWFEK